MHNPQIRLTQRLPLLTVIRFPAALVVFLFHFTLPQIGLLDSENESHSALRWLVDPAGGLGVTFFFILSGFVIAWSQRPGDSARGFWRRRFVKILPLYWISGVLAVIVNPERIELLPGYLVMSEAWFTHPAIALGLNAPGWSLCVEAFFYALFPLAIAPVLAKCTNPVRTIALAALAIMAIVGTVLIASAINVGVAMPLDSDVKSVAYWVSYVSPIFRLPEFVIGSCLALAVRAGWVSRISIWPAVTCMVFAYAICLYAPTLWSHRAILVIPSAWLILTLAVRNARTVHTRAPRWMMTLGELSFGFYLVHYPVLEAVVRGATALGATGGASPVPVALIAIVVSTGIAWALYTLIEQPLVVTFGSRGLMASRVRRRPKPRSST